MDPAVLLIVVRVLDLIATGIELLPEANERKERYLSMIRAMVEQDRGPNDGEWAELLADSDAQTDALRRILQAKRAAAST